MRTPLLAIVFGLSVTWLHAEEPTTDQLIQQLQAAVTKAVKEAKPGNAAEARGQYGDLSVYTTQLPVLLRRVMAQGDLGSLQQTLTQITFLAPSEDVQKLAAALEAKVQQGVAAREQAYITSVDQAVDAAVKAGFAAKDPKELDSSIISLSNMAPRNDYSNSEANRRAAQKAQATVTFLCRWQDYLMQQNSGNLDAAKQVLKALSQDTSSYPFIPRSVILEKMGPAPEGSVAKEPVLPDIKGKTLADLPAIEAQASELRYRNPSSQEVRRFSENLAALIRAEGQVSAGLLGQAMSYCTNQSGWNEGESFLDLRQQLLLRILPDYLDVGKTYPPQAGETPIAYLQRVIKEARAKGDWKTVWKTLECYRTVAFSNGPNPPGWLSGDIQGVSQFIIGQNYEQAGQYVDAVRAYKRVLAQTGENLPIEEATKRLEALKKDHPEEAAAAEKPVEAPMRQPGFPGNPNYPR